MGQPASGHTQEGDDRATGMQRTRQAFDDLAHHTQAPNLTTYASFWVAVRYALRDAYLQGQHDARE